MAYILQRDEFYCSIDERSRIYKTQNLAEAKLFAKKEKAELLLSRSTTKLKGFKVVEIDVDINEPVKEKRKQFTETERISTYIKNQGRCEICGRPVPYDTFTIDHIIPLSKGGTNELHNLQCACKTCNIIKQDILPEELMDKLEEIMLYQMQKQYNDSFYKKINGLRKEKRRNKVIKIINTLIK